jgi:hypothetical protein
MTVVLLLGRMNTDAPRNGAPVAPYERVLILLSFPA